ncbi:MAG TPA: hypothetical protein VFO07_05090, partial [Roseiflexaceae bacterium]|nr:hypothetical protein [Roseiflexaceae bacterium]
MPTRYTLHLLVFVFLLLSFWHMPHLVTANGDSPLKGDARRAPVRPTLAAAGNDPRPGPDQPSAFLAGRVAVRAIFLESNGGAEPSTEDWQPGQIDTARQRIAAALDWWQARLPNARLTFDLIATVVPSRYEPIAHDLSGEGLWIGDALSQLGYSGNSYFDQAYAADEALRRERGADWATTIFVANSAADGDGRFADGMFAYAYISGPFLVLTSDAGPYGAGQISPVLAHELGHIFGALDQYASAATPCDLQSGYLSVPTTNSQANNCGIRFVCIMLDPASAYPNGRIDESALGQVGYRDSDGDNLPDPLDTAPAMRISLVQEPKNGRPIVSGQAFDQPYPAATPLTINTIARVEYRVDGGDWMALPAGDRAYDSAVETIASTLPLYDGQHNLELRAINSVGAASPIFKQSVVVAGVGAQPAYAADAPELVNSAAITLTLGAPASAETQISENPFFEAATWKAATERASFNLTPTDGQHTIYVRFRDQNGLESPAIVRRVLLDRVAP